MNGENVAPENEDVLGLNLEDAVPNYMGQVNLGPLLEAQKIWRLEEGNIEQINSVFVKTVACSAVENF